MQHPNPHSETLALHVSFSGQFRPVFEKMLTLRCELSEYVWKVRTFWCRGCGRRVWLTLWMCQCHVSVTGACITISTWTHPSLSGLGPRSMHHNQHVNAPKSPGTRPILSLLPVPWWSRLTSSIFTFYFWILLASSADERLVQSVIISWITRQLTSLSSSC